MKKFKELFIEKAFNHKIDSPSVSLSLKNSNHTLHLRFDSKDNILEASYTGEPNPWFSSMCELILNKSLSEVCGLSLLDWDAKYKADQSYWDFKHEIQDDFLMRPLELLFATIDVFRGREYLYQEGSPLICRCFGIRESDVLEHLKKSETPTLETLSSETKAGMGCRSCVPQLNRMLMINDAKKHSHHYKDKPMVDWLLEIDYMLTCFPDAMDWNMTVEKFKNHQVLISYSKKVSQREEESMGLALREFLRASIDSELEFFLKRSNNL